MSDRRLQRQLEKESRLRAEDEKPRLPRFNLGRSGFLTGFLLATALLGLGLLWRAHQRAAFHKLTAPTVVAQAAPVASPGGQDVAVLTRLALQHSTVPQFVHATLLPGLGMQVLQLAVDVANHGTRELLAGPSAEELAADASLQPEVAPFHLLLSSPGQTTGGATDLVGNRGASSVTNEVLADGGEVTGSFAAVTAAGQPIGFDAKIDATMTGRSFDVDVRMRDNALASHDFSFEWSPRLRAPGGNLSHFLLHLPSSDTYSAGAVHSAKGTALDFSMGRGENAAECRHGHHFCGPAAT